MRGSKNDPFAALDGNPAAGPVDEISTRFPSLDQFSLLHDGGKFDFDASSSVKPPHRDLSQRVTEKLADDAFAIPSAKTQAPASPPKASASVVSRAQKIISSNPDLQAAASPPSVVYQPTPTRTPNHSYVSQGTMTSPTPPISYRFVPTSDHHRSASLPRNQEASSMPQLLRPEENQSLHPNSLPKKTSYGSQLDHARHTSSSRPSLEGGRPSNEALDPPMRTKSSNARSRPASAYLESNMDYLREKEKESLGRLSMSSEKRPSYSKESGIPDAISDEETHINSNVDFLRSMEDQETSKKDRRKSSGTAKKEKRSSMPSLALGTKNILAGKFGEAFKRFENSTSAPPGPRTPSPLQELARRDLTPIAGSEATDGRSDDGNVPDDADLPPEQRRELERRRLSMEERRVADAAAEYRKRLADRGTGVAPRSIGGVSRATSIQNKVKSLLDENAQSSPQKKTAEGYGRFTDNPAPQADLQSENPYTRPIVSRKPIVQNHGIIHARTLPAQSELSYPKPRALPATAPAAISRTGGPRPSAPPKPTHLNSISTGPQNSPPKQHSLPTRPVQARPDMTPQEREDYIADFSKRFPSLSGIEMVERDIEGDGGRKDGVGARSKVV
jgi:AP2-associated kinase